MNIFVIQYWYGFVIGLILITTIFYRARKFYRNVIVVLSVMVIAILMVPFAAVGFLGNFIKVGVIRGYDIYEDFVDWLKIDI